MVRFLYYKGHVMVRIPDLAITFVQFFWRTIVLNFDYHTFWLIFLSQINQNTGGVLSEW